MTDKKMIPLAAVGIDRLLLTEVARTLWCDVFWTEERETEYRQQAGCQFNPCLTARSETLDIPDLDEALFRLFHAVGRIEQAWGKSFHDVVCKMEGSNQVENVGILNRGGFHMKPPPTSVFDEKLESLVYRTLMSCIGHGISASDDGSFPEDLDPAPISIENPLQYQV